MFCVLLLQSKSPSYEGEPANPLALKSLLSYHKQNRRETTSFAFVVTQAGLEFLFYCFIWQCSMGWSGTHISLPTAGVAGPCYHTWLLKDAMPFKIHSRAANWEYGEDTDWSLDVSPFQMCHHFRPITGSTIKATPDWKGSVTHSTGYTDVMLKEARGNQCALSNQLPGVCALLVASVGTMTQMPKCPTTMENTHANILMWLTKQKTALYR